MSLAPIITQPFRPWVKSILSTRAPLISRHFTKFDSVANSGVTFDRVHTYGLPFELELWFTLDDNGGYLLADTESSSGNDRLALNSSGQLYGFGFGNITTGLGDDNDGQLHKMVIVADAVGDHQLYIDDQLVKTQVISESLSISFNSLGLQFGGSTSVPSHNGILADFKFWLGGDRHTGELLIDMPLDESPDEQVSPINKGSAILLCTYQNIIPEDTEQYTYHAEYGWLGADLISQQDVWENPYSVDEGWQYHAQSNHWHLEGDGSMQELILIPTAQQPTTALLKGKAANVTGDGLVPVAATNDTPVVINTGDYEAAIDISLHQTFLFKRKTGVVSADLYRPTLQPLMRHEPKRISRMFTRADGVAESFYRLETPIALGKTFEIEVYLQQLAPCNVLSGEDATYDGIYLDVQGAGDVRVFAYTGGQLQSVCMRHDALTDKLHKINVQVAEMADGRCTVRLYVDDELVNDRGFSNSDFWTLSGNENLMFLGKRPGRTGASQTIANTRVWISGHKHNGELVVDLPLDEKNYAYGQYTHNHAMTLGDNLFSGSGADIEAQHSPASVDDNGYVKTATWTGADFADRFAATFPTESGKTYQLRMKVKVAEPAVFYAQDNGNSATRTSKDITSSMINQWVDLELTYTAAGSLGYWTVYNSLNADPTIEIHYASLEIREVISGVRCEAVNFIPEDTELFTLDDIYGWLGNNLSTDPFSTGGASQWNKSASVTMTEPAANIVEVSTAASDGDVYKGLIDVDEPYLLSVRLSSVTGTLRLFCGYTRQDSDLVITEDGFYQTVDTSTTNGSATMRLRENTSARIEYFSAQKVMGVVK